MLDIIHIIKNFLLNSKLRSEIRGLIVSEEKEEQVRIDKWLWAARFYKTRSLARTMIEGGKVDYNGSRAKPSRIVEVGACIKLLQGNNRLEIIVKGISSVRGSATIARTLYEETPESIKKREELSKLQKMAAIYMPHPETKPDKKQRRTLISLKQQSYGYDN